MARPIRIQPPRLSEIELCAWIAQVEPGAVLEYYRGFLALDRTAFGRFGDTPARAALAPLGSRAHDLAERGLAARAPCTTSHPTSSQRRPRK